MRTLMMIWTFECSVAEDLLHLTACKHAFHDEIISGTCIPTHTSVMGRCPGWRMADLFEAATGPADLPTGALIALQPDSVVGVSRRFPS